MPFSIKCKGCGRKPDQIQEYITAAKEEGGTPRSFVIRDEGTFNRLTGAFWCTSCYIKAGQPRGKA